MAGRFTFIQYEGDDAGDVLSDLMDDGSTAPPQQTQQVEAPQRVVGFTINKEEEAPLEQDTD